MKLGGILKKHHKHDKDEKPDKVSAEDFEKLRRENEQVKDDLEDLRGLLQVKESTERFNDVSIKQLQSELNNCREEFESRIQSEQESDEALLASQSKNSELEAHIAATEEKHKAMQKKLAAEVTSKDSAANDAKAKLSQVEKVLAALREEHAESAGTEAVDVHQEVSELRAKLQSTEEEEQLLRTAASQHEQAMKELRDALTEAKEKITETRHDADLVDSSLVADLRAEIAQLETNAKQELEGLRLEMLSSSVVDPVTQLSTSTSEVAEADTRDDCKAGHLESQIRELQSEVSKSEALVTSLQSSLQLAETLASAPPSALDGQDDSNLRTCVPADVGGSAEREVSAHYDELRREVQDLREELEHTKDENFELINGQAENEIGLQEARDTNASLQARLLSLEAQAAESSEVARHEDKSARSETQAAEEAGDTASDDAGNRHGKLTERLECLESEVADLTKTLAEKSSATDERLTESEARQQEAEDALERSEAQRTSQQLALVDVQCECDAIREELAEKMELLSSLTEASASIEQANDRADTLVLELAEKDVTCDSMEETCERLKQELLQKEEAVKASEDFEAELREELQEVEEASASTAAALNEELARESAEYSAAVAQGKEESSENVALHQELAKHESAMEHSETVIEDLKHELEQAKASAQDVQPEPDENAPVVQDLRLELLQEKRRCRALEMDQALDPSETEKLREELDNANLEVTTYENLLNGDSDDALEQIKHLHNQCSKLREELRHANARASLAEADEAIRHEEAWSSRITRPTAEFGKHSGLREAQEGSSPSRKSEGSPTRSPMRRPTFDLRDTFDGNDTMMSDTAAFDEPSQPDFGFNPPARGNASGSSMRKTSDSSTRKAVSFGDNQNPFQEDKQSPFQEDISSNPFPEAANPFPEEDDSGAVDTPALPRTSSNPFDDGSPFSAVLSEGSSTKRLDDVVSREEYLIEVQACIQAREEAAQYAKKQDGADSEVARELQRAQRALADEEAKSRRLCEHALRAEQSRRSLYNEILENYKATDKDTDLVKLAQLVGRAAKSIAAVSAVAPRLAPAVFSPSQDSRADNASARISRTPASPRPMHQETLSGIQGAPGRPDGRPPRSPRQPGRDEPPSQPMRSPRIAALPYVQTQGGVPNTPSFEKAHPHHFDEVLKHADTMDSVGLSEIRSYADEVSLV